MSNKQTVPVIDTKVNRNMVSSQMNAANIKSPWRAEDFNQFGQISATAAVVLKKYADEEKAAAFKRFDLEASSMQVRELEDIRVADSNAAIPEIENNFRAQVSDSFSQQNWGKQWLKERGNLFFAANNRDVVRAGLSKQKELYSLEIDKTINVWANDISSSAPDKAKVLLGDMTKYIDKSTILSPEEKQKTKDNAVNLSLQRMASSNPYAAVELLKDKDLTKDWKIDTQQTIDSIIKKQFAEQEFQRRVSEFNAERDISEKLDDMATDEALRFLESNEAKVSSKYFKAKQKALLSAKGITAETRADEAFKIMQQISSLPKDAEKIEEYYKQVNNILTSIEEKYADGQLSAADRKKFVGDLYKKQGANLETLKTSDAGSVMRFWGYSYKDAAEDIAARYTGSDGNQIMLEYFRKINDGGEYDTDTKKAIMSGLIAKGNANELALPSFSTMDEAKSAYKSGRIKKGDKVYINGVKGTI